MTVSKRVTYVGTKRVPTLDKGQEGHEARSRTVTLGCQIDGGGGGR